MASGYMYFPLEQNSTRKLTAESMMALLLKEAVQAVVLIEINFPFCFASRAVRSCVPPRATDTNRTWQQRRQTASVGRAALVVAMVCSAMASCGNLLGVGHEWRTALWKDVRLLSTVLKSFKRTAKASPMKHDIVVM